MSNFAKLSGKVVKMHLFGYLCGNSRFVEFNVRLLLVQCILLSLVCSISSVVVNFPMTADDVRFAKARCQEDYGQANKTITELWNKNQYPDEPHTHCYVKCLFIKLGLVDPVTKGLHFIRLYKIMSSMHFNIKQLCPMNIRINVKLDGKCVSYYYQWMELRTKCDNLVEYMFFETELKNEVGNRIVRNSKPLGMKASEFCKSIPEYSEFAKIFSGESELYYKCRLCCVLRHTHYFNATGCIDDSEVTRSLHEAHHLLEDSTEAVDYCTRKANTLFEGSANCPMALQFIQCMHQTASHFSAVLEERDHRSSGY